MQSLLTGLETVDAIVILATNRSFLLPIALDRRLLYRVRFPAPDRRAREQLWRLLVPPGCCALAGADLAALGRYPLTGGYVKNAVLDAARQAAFAGRAEALARRAEALGADQPRVLFGGRGRRAE